MNKTLFLILISAILINAQSVRKDSLSSIIPFDSTLTNALESSVTDTLKKKTFDVDDVIISTASDSIKFDLVNKRMYIYGTGELKYKQTVLKGGKINVDFDTNELEAEGIIDESDSAAANGLMQTPVLSEGTENYEGTSLKYNF